MFRSHARKHKGRHIKNAQKRNTAVEFGNVRVIMQNGEQPWFVGKDVASVLGYKDTFGALKKHVEYEDKQNCQNDSFESPRGLTIINESGLYSLILYTA